MLTKSRAAILLPLAIALALPAAAQMPGSAERSRVTAGTYRVDPNHTQVE